MLVVPDGSYTYQGSVLVAECIAYGSPRPQITWSSPSLQIEDFDADGVATTTVVTRDAELDGLIVTYSTLHICPSTLQSLSTYLVEIQCSTTNGLSSPLGQQTAVFTAAPYSKLGRMYFHVFTLHKEGLIWGHLFIVCPTF